MDVAKFKPVNARGKRIQQQISPQPTLAPGHGILYQPPPASRYPYLNL
jgi:hypothetical protein